MKRIEWFTAYKHVVPSDYEKWFEDLAKEGWHPTKIRHTSSMRMVLEKSEPKKYKYAIELLGRLSPERKAMYADFGWEYVGRMSSIFVWRKEYTDKRPEMFSDKPSTKKRSQRFIVAISFSFGIFLLGFMISIGLMLAKWFGSSAMEWLDILIMFVVYGAASAYLYSVIRRIKRDKR
ncbi:MAG: DUF2812 domain-containing protein [Eubacteriales bacterium]